jgi:hypothetical protein
MFNKIKPPLLFSFSGVVLGFWLIFVCCQVSLSVASGAFCQIRAIPRGTAIWEYLDEKHRGYGKVLINSELFPLLENTISCRNFVRRCIYPWVRIDRARWVSYTSEKEKMIQEQYFPLPQRGETRKSFGINVIVLSFDFWQWNECSHRSRGRRSPWHTYCSGAHLKPGSAHLPTLWKLYTGTLIALGQILLLWQSCCQSHLTVVSLGILIIPLVHWSTIKVCRPQIVYTPMSWIRENDNIGTNNTRSLLGGEDGDEIY